MANRLSDQSSPYLLSHAENPVNWFPWGPEALSKALEEDKPIFLSIGYAACHWCHVMERESFQDIETAELLNRFFVSIKVDREERPDLDSIYMDAVQTMTGSGGWPLNVFLLPDTTPFFGGTYFPPESKGALYGIPSFPSILLRIADVFETDRDVLVSSGNTLVERLKRYREAGSGSGQLSRGMIDSAVSALSAQFDTVNGGFGDAPKFPQPMLLEFLLRAASSGVEAPKTVTTTLRKIACGGIHDHIGGGFHRYSTDEKWMVPHFEKMLYDNALLARVYTEAYLVTGDPLFRRTAEKTLDYLLRDMRDPGGAFYSSRDADSEPLSGGSEEEGAFYTWSRREIMDALGTEGENFCRFYNVTEAGNFQGGNILHVTSQVDEPFGLNNSRRKLLELRNKRPAPFRDEKIITSWNGMAIRAFAAASFPMNRKDYLEAAYGAAEFILKNLLSEKGRLLRSWKSGKGSVAGFLEDYALFARSLLEIHRATGDPMMFNEGRRITEEMIAVFRDTETGAFHQTGRDHENLFLKPSNPFESAVPSGVSAAADVLLQMWGATGEDRYRIFAGEVLGSLAQLMKQAPSGFGRLLCGVHFYFADARKVVLSGKPGSGEYKAFLEALNNSFSPCTVLGFPGVLSGENSSALVCGTGYCLPAVTDPADLHELLN